jgi:hypothetical protein
LAKSCAGAAWFVAARPALGLRGGPVVRVFLRWIPDKLPTIFPVRFNGAPVVLRQPSGRDLYMRDVVRPKVVGHPASKAGRPCADSLPERSDSTGVLLRFPAPTKVCSTEKGYR